MEDTNIEEEVWKCFEEHQIVFLSTSEGKQPRVRPVTLLHSDEKFWIITDTDSSKSKQLLENPRMELCLFLENKENPYRSGYVRAEGIAQIVRNREKKLKIGLQSSVFGTHFEDVDDPKYTLMEISLKRIEYLRPPEMIPHKIIL